MNGVFIRDAIFDGGLLNPKQFALDYYEKYPAINIGFYPPLFYLISAVFLLLFGVSHAASQAVVTLHAVAAGWFAYLLCAPRTGRLGAVAAATILLFVPGFALWARQEQLDVPAIAWLLCFAWCLVQHIKTGRVSILFLAAVTLGCAILTRVQMVFAIPVFALIIFGARYPNRPGTGLRLAAIVAACLIALPAGALLLFLPQLTLAQTTAMPGYPSVWSVAAWTWYATRLPEQLGAPALAWVLVGLLALIARLRELEKRQDIIVLAALLVASWSMFSLVSNKDPRFNLPSVALVIILSAIGLAALHRRLADWSTCALAAFLVVHVGLLTPVPVVRGYVEAATSALALARDGTNVLVAAHRDGSFIYNFRILGGNRAVGVRRADKLLVEVHISRSLGIQDRGYDRAQLLALLAKLKLDTVVMQAGYLDDQPTMRVLADLLNDPAEFELVQRLPITGKTDVGEQELTVYRRRAG